MHHPVQRPTRAPRRRPAPRPPEAAASGRGWPQPGRPRPDTTNARLIAATAGMSHGKRRASGPPAVQEAHPASASRSPIRHRVHRHARPDMPEGDPGVPATSPLWLRCPVPTSGPGSASGTPGTVGSAAMATTGKGRLRFRDLFSTRPSGEARMPRPQRPRPPPHGPASSRAAPSTTSGKAGDRYRREGVEAHEGRIVRPQVLARMCIPRPSSPQYQQAGNARRIITRPAGTHDRARETQQRQRRCRCAEPPQDAIAMARQPEEAVPPPRQPCRWTRSTLDQCRGLGNRLRSYDEKVPSGATPSGTEPEGDQRPPSPTQQRCPGAGSVPRSTRTRVPARRRQRRIATRDAARRQQQDRSTEGVRYRLRVIAPSGQHEFPPCAGAPASNAKATTAARRPPPAPASTTNAPEAIA